MENLGICLVCDKLPEGRSGCRAGAYWHAIAALPRIMLISRLISYLLREADDLVRYKGEADHFRLEISSQIAAGGDQG